MGILVVLSLLWCSASPCYLCDMLFKQICIPWLDMETKRSCWNGRPQKLVALRLLIACPI